MSARIIQVGIVGFGLSGRVFHAPFLHVYPGFNIRKVVERNSATSSQIYPYVNVVKNLEAVIHDPAIDLVVICSPNELHFSHVAECLKAGKHVVVEKPFTPTSAEANELIKLSESCGRKLFVYQNRRWDGDFKIIRQMLINKNLGEIQEYEAHFDRFRPEYKPASWKDENLAASGVLYDLGTHLIDQALLLFGKPQGIFADIRKQRPGSPVDDYFEVQLFYGSFKAILKASMMVKIPGPRYVIHGDSGSYVKYGIDPQEAELKSGKMPDSPRWGEEPEAFWGRFIGISHGDHIDGKMMTLPGNYGAFYDNVFQVLVNDAEIAVKPEEARDVILVIEKAYESNQKKKIIEF